MSSNNEKRGSNKRRWVRHILCRYSGPSYSDLPNYIVENILLRLSVKRIFVCKSVCKTWYDLISDPEFAKLHVGRGQVYPLIQTSGFTVLSRMLYLVQPKEDDFEIKLDCYHTSPECKLRCVCYVKIKLDTKFRLPLRNLEMIVNNNSTCEAGINNGLKLDMKIHKFRIVNSCNGLLCLSNPCNKKPVIVCNPVTGEFINLPAGNKIGMFDDSVCGFGFSPVTNQYKVIRTFGHLMGYEIHILGTKSWKHCGKDIRFFPYSGYQLTVLPTYLNGYLYWYFHETHDVKFFDIEKECFGSLSNSPYLRNNPSLGVLGGELCLSESFVGNRIDIWVLKDCNERKDWFKMLSINMNGDRTWPSGSYQLIKYLNNGALLMYNSNTQAFVYHNPKKLGFRYLKIRGMRSKVEAISHIPSFVLLKDAVSGLDTTVLNVRSRCGKLKLYKEGITISIVSED